MAAVIDLPSMATDLLKAARESSAGRSATAVFSASILKGMLIALVEGRQLAEHNAPPAATLQCLLGRARLWSADEAWLLEPGGYAAVPPARHGVDALSDCVLLLTVAAGQAPAPVEEAAEGRTTIPLAPSESPAAQG